MAVYRDGRLHRKATDQVAEAKQREMAAATIRKLTRRIERSNSPEQRAFLMECRRDVMHGPVRVAQARGEGAA
jgi:hypothetical protein